MVAWLPLAQRALKYTPMALAAARQLDRQLRPHVLAYRLARDVDGLVGRWTSDEGNHYVVFPSREGSPVRVFPPVSTEERRLLEREIDRSVLQHHSELPEAKMGQGLRGVTRRRGGSGPSGSGKGLPRPR
jgi:hypothetical protein